MARNSCRRRSGYTLVELIVAMSISTVLVAGLASSLYIAGRASTATGPAAETLRASDVALRISDELRYAIYVTERNERAVEFAVDDINGDGQPDVVRYEWSGTAGDPLLRAFNHAAPQAVAEDVRDFQLTYRYRESNEAFEEGWQDSSEVTLAKLTGGGSTSDYQVRADQWVGQTFFPSLPPDARSWQVTAMELELRSSGSADGETRIQLRPATGSGTPTSTVLEEVRVAEATLDSNYNWRDYAMTQVFGLSPKEGLCLVLEHVSGSESCEVRYQSGGIALPDHGLLESSNEGASWLLTSDKGLHFEVKGKYTTPGGPPIEVTRRYLTSVRMSLRTGSDAEASIHTGIPLLNTPEVLSGFWKLDFDVDPTTADVDFDGRGDWVVRGGGSFNRSSLVGGIWHADAILATYPVNDFAQLTTVDLRFRNTSLGGEGAVFRLAYDQAGASSQAVLRAHAQLQPDGTQTLTLHKMSDSETIVPLVTQTGLSDEFIDLRLVIDPATDRVAVWIDGASKGVYSNVPFSGSSDDRQATLMAAGSAAEFDFVSIRVSDNP
jgi:prepilin-type N-terminal cleavage/methylation domain-containing protein